MDPRHSPFASLTHEVEDDDKGERHSLVSIVRRLPYAIALLKGGDRMTATTAFLLQHPK